jgi:hypothetical protein
MSIKIFIAKEFADASLGLLIELVNCNQSDIFIADSLFEAFNLML